MGSELNLTPVQALGVALSGVFSDMEMGDCQDMAIDIVENLKSLNFLVTSILHIPIQFDLVKKL